MGRLLFIAGVALSAVIVLSVVGLVFFGHTSTDHGDSEPVFGPRLGLEGDTFDLGGVPADRTVERSITFTNQGTAPLEVTLVRVRPAPDAACGCGVERYEVRPGIVPTGASGELVFQLRVPQNMPDMEDVMIAELSTNDPATPSRKIELVFRMASEESARSGR